MPNTSAIFSGNYARLLSAAGILFGDGVTKYKYGSVDPTQTPVEAGIGSIYVNTTTGEMFRKQDVDNWIPLNWENKLFGYTGWDNATDFVKPFLTLSGANNETVNLTVVGGSDYFGYIKGKKVKLANKTTTLSGAAGLRYIYMNELGNMFSKTTMFNFDEDLWIAICYWDGTKGYALGYELHPLMDVKDHFWKHNLVGMGYLSGLAATTNVQPDTINNPADDSVQYLWLTTGNLIDENIQITIGLQNWGQSLGSGLDSTTALNAPFYYDNGAGIFARVAPMGDRTPFPHDGGNTYPQWNNAGVLTAAVNGDYVVYWVYGSNLVQGDGVFVRPHVAKYASLAAAQQSNPGQLNWAGFPAQEAKLLYRLVFRVQDQFTNVTHRAKLVSIQDYRNSAPVPVGSANASTHNSLSGRDAANAHPATAISCGPFTGLLSTAADVESALDIVDAIAATEEPGTVSSNSSGVVGVSEKLARQDHSHDLGSHAHTGPTDGGKLDHTTALNNVGTNTHAQIDSHIANETIHTKNYILNGDFEGDTVGQAPANVTVSGATAVVTSTVGEVLFGTKSCKITSSTHGHSFTFAVIDIDPALVGQGVTYSAWTKIIGTYNPVAGTDEYVIRIQKVSGSNQGTLSYTERQIPNGTHHWNGVFIPDEAAQYAITIVKRGATEHVVVLDQAQLTAKTTVLATTGTDWFQAPSADIQPVTSGSITWTNAQKMFRIDKDTLEGQITLQVSSLSSPVGYLVVTLPTGYSIDIDKLSGANVIFGEGLFRDLGATPGVKPIYVGHTTGTQELYILLGEGTTTSATLNSADLATGDRVSIDFKVPVVGYSSNIQVVDRALEEFASNSGQNGSANFVNDSSTTVYGPQGSNIIAVASNQVLNNYSTGFDVVFKNAIQTTDVILVEILSPSNLGWISADALGIGAAVAGTASYGISASVVGTHTVRVLFGNAGAYTSGSYGGAGANWNGLPNFKWRVRKVAQGALVGAAPLASNYLVNTDGSLVDPTASGAWNIGIVGAGIHHNLNNPVGITGATTIGQGANRLALGCVSDGTAQLVARGPNASTKGKFDFYTVSSDDSIAKNIAKASTEGAWTLGPDSGYDVVAHTINSGSVFHKVWAANGTAYHLGVFPGIGTNSYTGSYVLGAGDGNFYRAGMRVSQVWDGAYTDYTISFQTHNGGVADVAAGGITGLGAWTLGPSGFTGEHNIRGKLVAATAFTGTVTNVSDFADGTLLVRGTGVASGKVFMGLSDISGGGGAGFVFSRGGSYDTQINFYVNPSTQSTAGSLGINAGHINSEGAFTIGPANVTSSLNHWSRGRFNISVKDTATNGVTFAVYSDNGAAGTTQFYLETGGRVYVRTANWGTGGTAVGVSGGFLTLSPSSRRYKENEMPHKIDTSKIYQIQIKEFDYTIDKGRAHDFGPIAEDVDAILPEIVWKEDGVPESIRESKVVWLLLEEMKKLRTELEDAKARIAVLEAK